ncbi:hypothetical protein O53_4225 [Microcystis aeruginosa TAIHU98]|uniref:Uncharacterized protein n=1 Tax=Microcystis aeruginosa TAIHU98 TaxID=1134457 RepID=L7E8N4_MICAE|nr:hypothetical protein [Microcystis aeruginosa]ELP55394.1 hypothetical protein O53_4225 [Microcystis aeruginosa TAIHU98]
MANITISDLRPAGADLFSDSESYMHELTDSEMLDTLGGCRVIITWTLFCIEVGVNRIGDFD